MSLAKVQSTESGVQWMFVASF